MIIWITGFSGAGKTTIAQALVSQLKETSPAVVLLDGDAIRAAIGDEQTGHDRASRLINAYRICRLAQLMESQGLTVVVATMSLFHEIHAWNRQHFDDYVEVLVEVDFDILQTRNARGLYGRVSSGDESNVVGIDISPELPTTPHLTLNNNFQDQSAHDLAQDIFNYLVQSPVSL